MIKDTKSFILEFLGEGFKGSISLFRDMNDRDSFFVRYSVDESGEGSGMSTLLSTRFRDWIFSSLVIARKKRRRRKNVVRLTRFVKLKDIDEMLEGAQALARNDESIEGIQVVNRIGYEGGKIYYNLNDKEHRVVEISSEGWRMIKANEAPVLFVESCVLKEQPEPKRGGNLKDLHSFVNVDDRDFALVVGWLLSAMNSRIDCPMLHVEAPKGSGKTTLTGFLKELIDPDVVGTVAPFRSYRDLCAAAKRITVIGLDNISSFSKKDSDELCRVCTGTGHFSRKLYTDDELHTVKLHLPLIANGIDFGTLEPDLRDRCYSVRLQPLEAETRKSKEELLVEFEEKRPYILGALFDALKVALSNMSYAPEIDTRMLDAAKFVMRAAHDNVDFPFTEENFREILMEKKKADEKESVLYNPLASTIYNLVKKKREEDKREEGQAHVIWEGSSSKLHEEVMTKAKFLGISNGIPKSVASFGRKLRELAPMLELYGIDIKSVHTNTGTNIEIMYEEKEKEDIEMVETREEGIEKEVE